MSTIPLTRAAVDAAAPLTFDRPAKQDLTITVKATIDGFPIEVCFSGSIEQLLNVTRRLRALGAEPLVEKATVTAPLGGNTPARKPAAAVTYADDGTPLCANANCSRSGKPLEPSQHGSGYYCKGKDDHTGNSKGYCKTTAS